ncbi:hypothetical protein BJV77DRAFT_962581 [Russula vinacea]|nr:hypothetical protein BJV77DRAFT_962581 [Russula vinacea]
MPSSHSKHHPNSFMSSPTWSLNTLTGTTASGSGGPPVTPVMSPDLLDRSRRTLGTGTGTHMRMLMDPRRLVRRIWALSLYPNFSNVNSILCPHRPPPAKLNFNAVQPPSTACLHPSCNPNAMNEPAISTRATHLLLEIPGISGATSMPRARAAMASQVDYNQLPTENHKRAASSSFNQRNRAMPDPVGLRRFDLLGGCTTFAGLQRAANGADVWHVCFI